MFGLPTSEPEMLLIEQTQHYSVLLHWATFVEASVSVIVWSGHLIQKFCPPRGW